MKKTLSALAILCYFGTSCFAQELKTEKRRVSETLTETFTVDKSDKKIKTGWYQVMDDSKNLLAKGLYKNGKKDGIWYYTNIIGDTIQEYDFTNNKLILDLVDSSSIVHSQYQLLEVSDSNDKIEPPHKIGGNHYGFYLLYDARKIPAEVKSASSNVQMSIVFSISEKGELEGWTISYAGKQINNINIRQSTKFLPADAYEFTPAMLNGKPVRSKLSLWVAIGINHVSTPGTNNIMTQKTQE